MSRDAVEIDDGAPFSLPRKRVWIDPELDITSMIDLTFLLLIFFLVTSVPDVQEALELPPARHGVPVDPRTALAITLVDDGGRAEPRVLVSRNRQGTPLAGTPQQQESTLVDEVRRAVDAGRPAVLLQAERGVAHRHVARIAAAVSRVEGAKLHLAVLEIE